MAHPRIGYALVSRHIDGETRRQVQALNALGVPSETIWTDDTIGGRPRPLAGRTAAIHAATAPHATFVVTSLDRLGRTLGDIAHIIGDLDANATILQIGTRRYTQRQLATLHDTLMMLLAADAELFHRRTIDQRHFPPKPDPRGGAFRLTPLEESRLIDLFTGGHLTPNELAALFGVGRATVYRIAAPAAGSHSNRDAGTTDAY